MRPGEKRTQVKSMNKNEEHKEKEHLTKTRKAETYTYAALQFHDSRSRVGVGRIKNGCKMCVYSIEFSKCTATFFFI